MTIKDGILFSLILVPNASGTPRQFLDPQADQYEKLKPLKHHTSFIGD